MVQLWAHICRPLLNTICKKDSLNFKLWAHELLSADCCLTRYAEMIFWAVHQAPFNSLLLVGVQTSKSHSGVYIMLRLWSHIKLTVHQWLLLFCRIFNTPSCIGDISVQCASSVNSSLQAVPWQSAEVSYWVVNYIPAHSLLQLSAHFCRLLLVTVHTSKSLDYTFTSNCEHMSSVSQKSLSLFRCSQHYSIHVAISVHLLAYLCRMLLDTVRRHHCSQNIISWCTPKP